MTIEIDEIFDLNVASHQILTTEELTQKLSTIGDRDILAVV